jgi:transglutaminase-like putative cysteine protease
VKVHGEEAFLAPSDVVDFHHGAVASLARKLSAEDAVATAERCFLWVRDEVAHSIDVKTELVTCTASEVLAARTGLCYAKSHLLVALLRANEIPSGFVYQRLTVDGPNPPYCLHGLVAAFLPGHGMYRMDPRGNRPGIDARFMPPEERLAFTNTHPGERLFEGVRSAPCEPVLRALEAHTRMSELVRALPDAETL